MKDYWAKKKNVSANRYSLEQIERAKEKNKTSLRARR